MEFFCFEKNYNYKFACVSLVLIATSCLKETGATFYSHIPCFCQPFQHEGYKAMHGRDIHFPDLRHAGQLWGKIIHLERTWVWISWYTSKIPCFYFTLRTNTKFSLYYHIFCNVLYNLCYNNEGSALHYLSYVRYQLRFTEDTLIFNAYHFVILF